MDEKMQNACLTVTGVDEETGNTELFYIPLNIDTDTFEFLLENGSCTNKEYVSFKLDETEDEFWNRMWKKLMGENDEH